jgi:hypothetical protein
MFEKQRVAFSRKEIFGVKFKPAINPSFCTVSRMVFAGHINTDGTIDIDKAVSLTKEELWAYVYYLYFYNHTNVPIFQAMKNPENGKASALNFYEAVISMVDREEETNDQPAKPFDTTTLIIFINNVIEEFGKQLVNPIFDYLHVILERNIVTRLSGITLVTGDNKETGESNKIKIVTNAKNVANANVKVSFTVDKNAKKT